MFLYANFSIMCIHAYTSKYISKINLSAYTSITHSYVRTQFLRAY